MKKRMAAMLLLAGMLCACGTKQKQPMPQPIGSMEQSQQQAQEQPQTEPAEMLSDYVQSGVTLAQSAARVDAIVPFRVGDRYAVANSGGCPVTDAVYDSVKVLNGDGEWYWVLREGERVTCATPSGNVVINEKKGGKVAAIGRGLVAIEKSNGKLAVYRRDGTLARQFKLEDGALKLRSCDRGMMILRDEQENWYLAGMADKELIPLEGAKKVSWISDGQATVRTTDDRWGILSRGGAILTVEDVVWLGSVRGGYLLAKNADGMYGVLSTNGRTVRPFEYTRAKSICTDPPLFQLWKEDGKCEVRNVATTQKVRLPSGFAGEDITVWSNLYYSYTTEDGNAVLFDELGAMELPEHAVLTELSDDIIAVSNGESFSLVHISTGEQNKATMGSPVEPDELSGASSRHFAFEQDGKQGICDTAGRPVIAAEYDWVRPTGADLFAAEQGDRCGLLNTDGEWVTCLQRDVK